MSDKRYPVIVYSSGAVLHVSAYMPRADLKQVIVAAVQSEQVRGVNPVTRRRVAQLLRKAKSKSLISALDELVQEGLLTQTVIQVGAFNAFAYLPGDADVN